MFTRRYSSLVPYLNFLNMRLPYHLAEVAGIAFDENCCFHVGLCELRCKFSDDGAAFAAEFCAGKFKEAAYVREFNCRGLTFFNLGKSIVKECSYFATGGQEYLRVVLDGGKLGEVKRCRLFWFRCRRFSPHPLLYAF